VHALTLLANDKAAEWFWFWNGFGMLVVDAIRGIQPLQVAYPHKLEIRRAGIEDAGAIAELEVEHWAHYAQPPTLMAPQTPEDAVSYRKFLSQPHNSVWLVCDGKAAVGYMRFETQSFGATEIVRSEKTTAITAAYTQPAYRGQGAAPALLDAALQHYGALGYERCSVDFESINPEASNFWLKYFTPVCFSLNRHPEV
jgi:ribosomal protein S18 acetylase RimI-like enzyme